MLGAAGQWSLSVAAELLNQGALLWQLNFDSASLGYALDGVATFAAAQRPELTQVFATQRLKKQAAAVWHYALRVTALLADRFVFFAHRVAEPIH